MQQWNKGPRRKRAATSEEGRKSATASKDEAGESSYVWEAWRHYIRPSDKLMSWRSKSE
jgi:hypothetical protein